MQKERKKKQRNSIAFANISFSLCLLPLLQLVLKDLLKLIGTLNIRRRFAIVQPTVVKDLSTIPCEIVQRRVHIRIYI